MTDRQQLLDEPSTQEFGSTHTVIATSATTADATGRMTTTKANVASPSAGGKPQLRDVLPANADASGVSNNHLHQGSSSTMSSKVYSSYETTTSALHGGVVHHNNDHSLLDAASDDDDDDGDEFNGNRNHDPSNYNNETMTPYTNQVPASTAMTTTPSHIVATLFAPQQHQHSNLLPTTTMPLSTTTATPKHRRWDHFVRSGTQIQSLLSDVITDVQSSLLKRRHDNKRPHDDDDTERQDDENTMDEDEATTPQRHSRVTQVADFTVELAREKTALVMQLQLQLKDAQVQSDVMKAANAALREETASTQSRLSRTMEALRVAGQNAAKARADADAAEATAATLAQTLQSLQTVIAETKQASQILHREQQAVSLKASQVETKLLQKESDLIRAQKELTALRSSQTSWEQSNIKWMAERKALEQQVQHYQTELQEAQRAAAEQHALETARKQRADQVVQDLHHAQTLLQEATAGQAVAEQTHAVLQETIATLQQSNQELQTTLQTNQGSSQQEHQRLLDIIHTLETQTQRLRIAADISSEEMQKLQLEKQTAEQHVSQLQAQLLQVKEELNGRRSELASVSGTTGSSTLATVSPMVVAATPTHLSFRLPPLAKSSGPKAPPLEISSATSMSSSLQVGGKENNNAAAEEGIEQGSICCICFKASYGVMKSCQCGRKSLCHKQAHITCFNKSMVHPGPSVSHPGTPAPPLPVILCNNNGGGITSSKTTLSSSSGLRK